MTKFKNYGLWIAIGSLLLMLLQDTGVHITPDKFEAYENSVLSVLILLGIISSPNKGKGFSDKRKGDK